MDEFTHDDIWDFFLAEKVDFWGGREGSVENAFLDTEDSSHVIVKKPFKPAFFEELMYLTNYRPKVEKYIKDKNRDELQKMNHEYFKVYSN